MTSTDLVPATETELFMYRGMFTNVFCIERKLDIDFKKSITVATFSYVNFLNGKHGGKIESLGHQKLEEKQLISAAEFQIITGAMQFCPDYVPDEIKEKIKKNVNPQAQPEKTPEKKPEKKPKKKGFFR